MSSFQCNKCGTMNLDSVAGNGVASGCWCRPDPLDTLEDAVVAKANREYVIVSRDLALEARDMFSDASQQLVAQATCKNEIYCAERRIAKVYDKWIVELNKVLMAELTQALETQ